MELEKLTALQLGEKIKQCQVSVLDGVKTVFEQIEKQAGFLFPNTVLHQSLP